VNSLCNRCGKKVGLLCGVLGFKNTKSKVLVIVLGGAFQSESFVQFVVAGQTGFRLERDLPCRSNKQYHAIAVTLGLALPHSLHRKKMYLLGSMNFLRGLHGIIQI